MSLLGTHVIDFPISKIWFLLLHHADDIRHLPFTQPDQNYRFLLGMGSRSIKWTQKSKIPFPYTWCVETNKIFVRVIWIYIYIYIYIYTGCPRGNLPDFGRMFLKLKYTDITQKTYIRSWTVTEIMARGKCGILAVSPTLPGSRNVLPYTAHVRPSVYSRVKRTHTATADVKCLET